MAVATTDAALVRRLQERDRDAWEEAYAAYAPRLTAFAYRLAGNPHDAADLVQETFVRVLPRLARLDPESVDLAAYLFGTLKNLFLKSVERTRRQTPVCEVPEPAEPVALEDDPLRALLLQRQQEELRVANAELAPRQRLVLSLRELEDKSYAEIAGIVGVRENAVAQLILRARSSLRERLRLAQIDGKRLEPACEKRLGELSAYLDGQLKGDKLARVREHLDACTACAAALEDFRTAGERYRSPIPQIVGLANVEDAFARVWEVGNCGRRRSRANDVGRIVRGRLRPPHVRPAVRRLLVVTIVCVVAAVAGVGADGEIQTGAPATARRDPPAQSARLSSPDSRVAVASTSAGRTRGDGSPATPRSQPQAKSTPKASLRALAPAERPQAPPTPTVSEPEGDVPPPPVRRPTRPRPATTPTSRDREPTEPAPEPRPPSAPRPTRPAPATPPPEPQPAPTTSAAAPTATAPVPAEPAPESVTPDPAEPGPDPPTPERPPEGTAPPEREPEPPAPDRPPDPAPQADLVIAASGPAFVVVTNAGRGRAGAFAVAVGGTAAFSSPGLAPGESVTFGFPCSRARREATADATGLVAETDERNNSAVVPACDSAAGAERARTP